MADIVLIPCFRRPEFLWHCLDRIQKARGSERLAYFFKIDYGYNPEILTVIDQFKLPHFKDFQHRPKYQQSKQSFNVLTGYSTAANFETANFVFMIEEDVLVSTDFFEWHYAVNEKHPELFCSLSTRNHNRREGLPTGGQDNYYLTTNDYCSLGVCFKKSVLRGMVIPHAVHAYFASPIAYCKKEFPGSTLAAAYSEQDGLIRRIQEGRGMKMPIAYPCVPRAYHCGFYGKNRKQNFFMGGAKLSERIDIIGNIIYSDENMRRHAMNDYFYFDSQPEKLDYEPIPTFTQV